MSGNLVNFIYLVAGVLFILGVKGLTKPKTAVRGNFLSALGMLVAVVVTLFNINDVDFIYVIAGVALGGIVGALMALRVQMTSIPQMVALLNGFGGGASLSIALAEYITRAGIKSTSVIDFFQPKIVASNAFGEGVEGTIGLVSICLTVLIGAVTLTGSLVAFSKLQEWMKKSYGLPGGPIGNGILLLSALTAIVLLVINPGNMVAMVTILGLALLLGLFLVMPIGGADMPVVIALLNSYSGIAAALAGFILGNTVLIIAGSLVGTSGLILTRIMCVAMNRSLANVLFGKMAASGEIIDADEIYAGKVTSAQPDEVAMLLETAQRVVIVPGYGMAMAQAQHAVRELADAMEAKGVEVEYGIHPVAGRMPGHMNVLLAEAEVPYDKLVEMDRINPTFEDTDVVIVIGANDVTNPMARDVEGSPIYGMPILNVDKAKTVVVIKRSLSPGFAGLPNPLFAMDHTLMVYGDGKKAVVEMTMALNQL
ncbi:MAG: NAD synthetase [SAR92 bacterium BACL26 MAG-121220-bin70]|jgi:H+-translocating NAD(P) transhydrogenase subunit beta|uniref:NAD(P) transhydrogenase subunit beta n=1 Tax=SAR92 bacterium BACL26 MAG-121220-bin70 TaxID=1655626 RepID=A0A0R2U5V6_9GAMM|nr:MAG: NAD synthetase [SAR92 bacterium BACL26 MAG-121220-bin70]|tara:strand:+ start:1787 stop:3232 length:1446 start_codon:yes stop_codon:yes gene_type:complete